jgi:hypothetical protein
MDGIDVDRDETVEDPREDLLPVLTLSEAQDAIEVLQYYATANSWYGDTAVRIAQNLAARVPSRD